MNRFDVPSAIFTGGGSRRQLGEIARELGARRALIVTDPGVVQLGFVTEIQQLLVEAGCDVRIFDGVQPDPTDRNVADGFAAFVEHNADLVVAVGGGSPIDTAKVIAIRATNPEPLPEFMGPHKIKRAGAPLIAIPTTAGTGSEATKVAVITDTERDVKMMMLSTPLLPRVAIVDFELSMGMPKPLTAAVGVDTLTHGIEAYVSKKANAMTDPLALSCIDLVGKHLKNAWENPDDREAREGMMLAACQGGMAFSNSSVCLVHGMSRPIGAVFHLPHGLSNAILLPTVTAFSEPAAAERYATIAHVLGCKDEGLVSFLTRLNDELKLPRFSQCQDVTRDKLDAKVQKMAADALASGSPANNPRVPTADEIVELYEKAW